MTVELAVTGGYGFIGSAFLRRMSENVSSILNIDSLTYAGDRQRLAGRGIQTVEQDVADDRIQDVFVQARPNMVVHFAAETHVTRSEHDPANFHRTNIEGTRRVMKAAERAGAQLVVHVSTDEVYGPCTGSPFLEEEKVAGEGLATSTYARSKAVADDLALSFRDRVPVIVVRPSNCFGPWQHPEKAVPRWIIRALEGHPLPVWGDGGQVRDWMFVDDAVAGLMTIIEKGTPGEVYNLAPENAQVSNLEIARAIAEIAGRDASDVYLTSYDRPQHDRRYAVDSSKLRRIGWQPTWSLTKALSATIDWYLGHRHWWGPKVAEAEALYNDAGVRPS